MEYVSYYDVSEQASQSSNEMEGDDNSYSQGVNKKDSDNIEDLEEKSGDLSGVLGAEICRSTSDDLVNMIYSSFKSCSSANKNGNCCSSMSICRCGSGCKCEGCNTHILKVEDANSRAQPDLSKKPSSSCCAAPVVLKHKHTVVIDEEGVSLCGCGCRKSNSECSDCVESLCEGKNFINKNIRISFYI